MLKIAPAPSGKRFGIEEVEIIRAMAEFKTLVWTDTPFRLNSGVYSNVYFFGREDLTDNPVYSKLFGKFLGRQVCEYFNGVGETRRPIVIGVPTAGNGFAASVTHYDAMPQLKVTPPGFRVMREKLKETHGSASQKGYWVNGRSKPDTECYATMENVVTSGESHFKAIDRLNSDGYPTKEMPHFVVMDRQQGGVKKMQAAGYNMIPIFLLLDTIWAFKTLGVEGWTAERVATVENEIRTKQVA
ncbi:MAG: hypothetical protein V4668_04075 [Patescibacteria group bacterium]